ncbi:MAG: 5'-methylthioadenosine/adenosylhomocysteine nucleosidase [Planctomycetes bacterium]|nr:5'-methylthioadenosine/adenosylhomocysteine nucleosidase [Planctomycetota bacterium]
MKPRCLAGVFCLVSALSLASCTTAPGSRPQERQDTSESSSPKPNAALAAPSRQTSSAPILAVLGAVNSEVTLLQGMLTDAKSQEIEGIEFISGRIGAQSVVLAWTGVGKVNAAMTTTLLLEHCHPTRVIFTGIAGGVDPNLEPGDIVIAKQTAYHDMGTLWPQGLEYGGVKSRMTGEPNPVFFPADPVLLTSAEQAAKSMTFGSVGLQTGQRPPKAVVGTVVTGDVFVASKDKSAELAKDLGACAVEMEGAAVAQLCYQRGIGCLVIRSISDKADRSAVMDKQLFYTMAAKNSAGLVVEIVGEGLKRAAE